MTRPNATETTDLTALAAGGSDADLPLADRRTRTPAPREAALLGAAVTIASRVGEGTVVGLGRARGWIVVARVDTLDSVRTRFIGTFHINDLSVVA